MLPLMLNALPPSPAAAQTAASPSAVTTAGVPVSDPSAAARQQLPNAVAASGAPAAFSPYVPQPPKIAPARPGGNAAQSPLAAQLLAQDNALSDDAQTIFHPPATPATPADSEAQAVIDAMHQARGDAAASPLKPDMASRARAEAEAPVFAAPTYRPETKNTAAGRKPGIEARGSAAYKVAAERGAALPLREQPVEL